MSVTTETSDFIPITESYFLGVGMNEILSRSSLLRNQFGYYLRPIQSFSPIWLHETKISSFILR